MIGDSTSSSGGRRKPEQVGGFTIVDSENILTYTFDGKAQDLGPAIAELGYLNPAMRTYRLLMLILLILLTAGAWFATDYIGWAYPKAYEGGMSMTFLGVIFVIIAYTFNKCVSNARSVNPTKESRQVAYAIAAIAGFMLFFPLVGNFTNFFEPVVTAKRLVYIGTDMENALLSVGISVMWVAVLCGVLAFRRIGKTVPQRPEIHFYERLVGHLLRDLSPRARCQVTINPLPVLWSTRMGVASSGKSAEFDLLLSARIRLGPQRRISIRVLHRRTQRGQRKNKGSKHKVKVSIRVTDPRLQRLSDKTKKSLTTAALGRTADRSDRKERYPFKWKPDSVLHDNHVDGAVGWVETYLNPNAFLSRLGPKDIPSPYGILSRVRELFLAIDELPQRPLGADDPQSKPAGR